MKWTKKDFIYSFVILIISLLFVADLFINPGEPDTFDSPTHITTMAQFHRAYQEGEIRPVWGDGFANYGMPIPLIAQQVTSSMGGYLTFITHDIVTSYKIVAFIGTFLSALFFYIFLRLYFEPDAAFAGTFLFNVAPYRIINLYIRGAIPEFFSSVALPLTLIGMYKLKQQRWWSPLLIAFSLFLLILIHPFMFIVGMFVIAPYFIYLLWDAKDKVKLSVIFVFSLIIGILMTGYYLVPLNLEIKYFYYGLDKNHLGPNQILSLENYFTEHWYYFYHDDIAVRGHFLIMGFIELLYLIGGSIYLSYNIFKKKAKNMSLIIFCLSTAAILIFFSTGFSEIFYKKIDILSGIQRPWRMLSGLLFIPPILCAYFFNKISHLKIYYGVLILFFVIVAFLRFPQLYGKNNTIYPQSHYYFTPENLHSTIMNIIWTGRTRDYPIKPEKPAIIEGRGKIEEAVIKNSSRHYQIDAQTSLRMVDYTFYFPGWNVYVDGVKTDIQFQDPQYRGVITYNVPAGRHKVSLLFEYTKIMKIGVGVSIIGFLGFFSFFFLRKRIFKNE